MTTRFYLIDRANVARVADHRYAYLDHVSGKWVEDPAVFDTVTFEASTKDLTADEARQWITKHTRWDGYALTLTSR